VTSRRGDDLPAEVDVVVVGGGIVGRSVASSVARRGRGVLLLDAGGERFGTSNGNAGHLVPSHVVPFAAPGMVRAGLTSLARRDGAFAISSQAGGAVTSWLWRFARSSTERNVERGVPALRELLDVSIEHVEYVACLEERRRLRAVRAFFELVPRLPRAAKRKRS